MQARGRRGDRALLPGVNSLVILNIQRLRFSFYVRRQRHHSQGVDFLRAGGAKGDFVPGAYPRFDITFINEDLFAYFYPAGFDQRLKGQAVLAPEE